MSLYLVFEHVHQDLATYLEKCPAPGLAPDRIKVGDTVETDRTAEETQNVTLLSLNHTAGDTASQLSQGMVAPAPQSPEVSVQLHEQLAN